MTEPRRFFRPTLAFSAGWRRRGPDGGGEDGRAARDRADGFREQILPHMDAAYNLARYLARDATAAEDIVQNAFLRAFKGYAGFRGDAPKAWLLAIVRNAFLDWHKARRADPVSIDDGAPWDAPSPANESSVDHDTPEAILGRNRDAAALRATIEDLPEPFREAIVLRELEELSYREISMIAGVPIGTVMSRLARGRQMLSELLVPSDDRARVAGA